MTNKWKAIPLQPTTEDIPSRTVEEMLEASSVQIRKILGNQIEYFDLPVHPAESRDRWTVMCDW